MRRVLGRLLFGEYTIAQGTVLFIGAFLASAVLGIVRQALFNEQFGTGDDANAFVAAFRLPETIDRLITGGVLAGAMMPVLVGVAQREGAAAEALLASRVATLISAVVLVIVAVCIVATPWFVRSVLAPGFSDEAVALCSTVTRILLLQLVFGVLTTVLIALLNRRNQFGLTALVVVTGNLTVIAGILVARAIPAVGVIGPATGYVADSLLHVLLLLGGLRRNHVRLQPRRDVADRHVAAVLRLLVPGGLSSAVNYAGGIIDTAFASLAREPAAISALHNANLLVGLPLRLGGIALAQAAYPRLAGYAERGAVAALRRLLLTTLAASMALVLPAALVLAAAGRDLVRILFERGRFDAESGALTALLLAYLACGLPAYVATELLSRALGALRDTVTPLVTNLAQTAARAALIAWWLGSLGASAIPLVFVLTSTAETVVLALWTWSRLRRMPADGP
jgi:putative peptidoglycan lipid II flippase